VNLIQHMSYEQSLIGYEQSLVEEIWRLTKEIEQAQEIGHTLKADQLLYELEAKLADYVKVIKGKDKLTSIG